MQNSARKYLQRSLVKGVSWAFWRLVIVAEPEEEGERTFAVKPLNQRRNSVQSTIIRFNLPSPERVTFFGQTYFLLKR